MHTAKKRSGSRVWSAREGRECLNAEVSEWQFFYHFAYCANIRLLRICKHPLKLPISQKYQFDLCANIGAGTFSTLPVKAPTTKHGLVREHSTGSTAKLYMAIFSGCIPIIFLSFKGQLPFIHFIDWTQFSVPVLKDIIKSPKALSELLAHLQSIRANSLQLQRYKSSLEKASRLFDFRYRDWPSAYHLTLLEYSYEYGKLRTKLEKKSGIMSNFLL